MQLRARILTWCSLFVVAHVGIPCGLTFPLSTSPRPPLALPVLTVFKLIEVISINIGQAGIQSGNGACIFFEWMSQMNGSWCFPPE